MDIKTAIDTLIQAAQKGSYSNLEQIAVNQAIQVCLQLEIKPKENAENN